MEAMLWRPGQTLAERYMHDYEVVAPRYDHDWRQDDAFLARAAGLDRTDAHRAPREAVANALIDYNQRIGNDPAAIAAIDQLRQRDTLVVCGGQQAGLLTGPLLVIHKAISVIRAAGQAAERLGRPVLPVFWIAGEDHDFAEVNHVHVLSSKLTIERIGLHLPREEAARRLAISRRRITPEKWAQVLMDFESVLPQTEYTSSLLAGLRDVLQEADTLSVAFAKLMASLFGKHGLILLDADDAALRETEVPFFHKLIDGNAALEQALFAGKAAVEKLGHAPQADVQQDAANLFYIQAGERLPLFRQREGTFADRHGDLQFRAEELRLRVADDPACLSNNVFSRPLMQEYVLPVLATVLGPGEIAYWGLLKEAFNTFGMDMPIVLPRLSFTLVEGTVQKQMGKLGLSFADALFHLEERRAAWLREQDGDGIEEHFAEVKRKFAELYAPTVQLAGGINPGLKALGDKNLGKILDQITYLEARMMAAHRAKHDTAMRQFDRIGLSLAPLGKEQERVYNVFPVINKYGPDWIDAWLRSGEVRPAGQHYIYYL